MCIRDSTSDIRLHSYFRFGKQIFGGDCTAEMHVSQNKETLRAKVLFTWTELNCSAKEIQLQWRECLLRACVRVVF